ncbi:MULTISPECIES: hypothetical protein [Chryseobacterium group]|nr:MULTISPECIES: hypothetical protein [Chryseobacterium group]
MGIIFSGNFSFLAKVADRGRGCVGGKFLLWCGGMTFSGRLQTE